MKACLKSPHCLYMLYVLKTRWKSKGLFHSIIQIHTNVLPFVSLLIIRLPGIHSLTVFCFECTCWQRILQEMHAGGCKSTVIYLYVFTESFQSEC